MSNRTPIIAANWKMNKLIGDVPGYAEALSSQLEKHAGALDVVVAPPATHLTALAKAAEGTKIQVGAQNCGTAPSGAFTGEISAEVLKEIGCPWVILGHSERRHVFGESNVLVEARMRSALEFGLKAILCVGETLEERKANHTFFVIESQLAILKGLSDTALSGNFVVAYEPVWAIGTGETASPEQAEEVHASIRDWIGKELGSELASSLRIQYGGSVKPGNALELMRQENVDGFLVGGASLEADSFFQVIQNGLQLGT